VKSQTHTQPCGCEWQLQPISRSLHLREIWAQLCPTHGAEFTAEREAARASNAERNRHKALEEEFT